MSKCTRAGRLALALAAIAVVASHEVSAQDGPRLLAQPRLSIGVQDYEISFEDVTAADAFGGLDFRDGFELGDTVEFLGAGLTLTYGRFFADLSGQWSREGTDETDQFQGTATGFGFAPGDGHNHLLQAEFDRQELNVSLGWGISSSFSVYAGFKHAEVDLRNRLSPVLSPFPGFGDVLFFGDREIDFSYDGGFVGATYSLPVGSSGGAFAIQSSLALLDGTFKERFVGTVAIATPVVGLVPIDPSFVTGEINGDSVGLNVGVSWTAPFPGLRKRLPGFTYTLGIDHSQYEFDTSESTTGNFEERNSRLRLDFRYRPGARAD